MLLWLQSEHLLPESSTQQPDGLLLVAAPERPITRHLRRKRPSVLSSTLFTNLICGFWLCTPTHITGMLLPNNSAPTLLGTTYPRFFPPGNFKHDRTKGYFTHCSNYCSNPD